MKMVYFISTVFTKVHACFHAITMNILKVQCDFFFFFLIILRCFCDLKASVTIHCNCMENILRYWCLLLCGTEEKWINDYKMFIFGWNIPSTVDWKSFTWRLRRWFTSCECIFVYLFLFMWDTAHMLCYKFISDFLVCVSVSQTQLFYRCCCITCMFISEPLLSTSMHVHKDSLSLLISVFCVFVTSTLHLHWAAFVHICTLVAYGRIVLINSDLLVLLIQNRWTHSSSGRGRDEEEM